MDFTFGDVHLWQEWYKEINIQVESNISCLYQLQQPRDGQLEIAIRSFHSHFGHTINGDATILTGSGSTQVIHGLIYSFNRILNHPVYYEQIPRHELHKTIVEIQKGIWSDNSVSIEFVTCPNNPDGSIKFPITTAPIIIWDAVYAWPWYGCDIMKMISHIKKSCAGRVCIPVFSFSYSLGLAGQRVGYAIIPPSVQKKYPNLVSLYQEYISISSMGTCRSGEGICRVISSGHREFPLITERLEQRYDLVTDKLQSLFKDIRILSPRGFAYLWIHLPGIDLYSELLSRDIYTLPGSRFGMTDEYVRMNLMTSTSTIMQLYRYQDE